MTPISGQVMTTYAASGHTHAFTTHAAEPKCQRACCEPKAEKSIPIQIERVRRMNTPV